MRNLSRWWIFGALGYLALVGGIIAAMLAVRENTLAELGTAKARTDWTEWKAGAAEQDGIRTPVQRSVPQSNEPPLMILMRDHFVATTASLLVPVSALYLFVLWIVRGVINTDQAPPGEHDKSTA